MSYQGHLKYKKQSYDFVTAPKCHFGAVYPIIQNELAAAAADMLTVHHKPISSPKFQPAETRTWGTTMYIQVNLFEELNHLTLW